MERNSQNTESEQERLRQLIQNKSNYRVLLQKIGLWVPLRQAVITKVAESRSDLSRLSTWCAVGRIIGYTMESLCTFGGLFYVNTFSLNTATLCGIFGFLCTLIDTHVTKLRLRNLKEIIILERGLFWKVGDWFKMHEEIHVAMNELCSLEFSNDVDNYMKAAVFGNILFDPVLLIAFILLNNSAVKQKFTDKNGYSIIEKLKDFVNENTFKEYA